MSAATPTAKSPIGFNFIAVVRALTAIVKKPVPVAAAAIAVV